VHGILQTRAFAPTSTSPPTSSAPRSETPVPAPSVRAHVGPKEAEARAVGVRSRDAGVSAP
jgi:hypothetical protein